MPNSYMTLDELKAKFPSNKLNIDYDALLTGIIETASREIDTFTKREPGAFYVDADSTRYFNGNNAVELWIDEIAAVPTTVAVAEAGITDNASGSGGSYTTWSVNDFYMWPDNALQKGMPYMKIIIDQQNGTKSQWYGFRRGVKITGKFGFATTIPSEIAKATTIQAVRYFKRIQQAFADTGAITELGQLTYVKDLDPEVRNILSADKFATSIL